MARWRPSMGRASIDTLTRVEMLRIEPLDRVQECKGGVASVLRCQGPRF